MKKTSTTLQSRTQDDVFDYQITKNSRVIDYGMSMTQEVPQKAPHSNNGRISIAFFYQHVKGPVLFKVAL